MILQAFIKGITGEFKSSLSQFLFLDSKEYHVFNNVIVQASNGTTQIDHVIVSRYGIFVIETKNRNGWIFGDYRSPKWTEKLYGKTYQFQNPLHQNYKHTKSLAEILKIDERKLYPIIVFWGNCEFKTQMPENVLKKGYIDYIKSKIQILLTVEEIERISNQIISIKNNTPFFGGFQHTASLKKRYESITVFPKCGANLVERTSQTGVNKGTKFLGCSNFPRCSYKKSLN